MGGAVETGRLSSRAAPYTAGETRLVLPAAIITFLFVCFIYIFITWVSKRDGERGK